MSLRRLARETVVQALFSWDFNEKPSETEKLFNFAVADHTERLPDVAFPKELFENTIKKVSVIDEIITKAAPSWPLEKIAIVDRNILRLGIYELLFSKKKDVPPRVAINEAIELAKTFGGPQSFRFVSGVLGSIYEASDLKDKDPYAGKKAQEVPYEKMPIHQKAGAVVFARNEEGVVQLAFVHDIFGRWTLSKGGVEKGESPEQACVREIQEEIGVDITLLGEIGSNEYIAKDPEEGKVRKQVKYFLGETTFGPLTLEKDGGGLTAAKWFSIEEYNKMYTYNDVKKYIQKGIDMIPEQGEAVELKTDETKKATQEEVKKEEPKEKKAPAKKTAIKKAPAKKSPAKKVATKKPSTKE